MASERGHAPTSILISAGPTFFMAPTLDADHRAQDTAKAEALAASLAQLGFVAWAPAANDWAAGAAELARLSSSSKAPPLDLTSQSDAGAQQLPTRVLTLGGLRVAFLGVGGRPGGAARDPGVIAEAVREATRAARAGGADVVIALASTGRGEAKRIADAVPDLTAIVVGEPETRGDANTPSPPGEQVGNVVIAETANHLQSVGVLDLVVRGDSRIFADGSGLAETRRASDLSRRIEELRKKIAAWERDQSIAAPDLAARRRDLEQLQGQRAHLDAGLPPAQGSYFRYALHEIRDSLGDDPGVKAALASYYRLVNEDNRVAFAGRVPPPPLPGQASFVGVAACRACHLPETKFWEGTGHAGAYATLSSQNKEFNVDCVSCHVTGYGKPGGSTVTHVDALKDVQCETCHGPGSLHAAAPKTASLSSPGPDACLACHRPPHVEGFDPVAKMTRILGPGHGG
jgi:hypothetical protein